MHFGWITKGTCFTLLLLGAVTLGLWLNLIRLEDQSVKVVFLSVGQGDAILIQSGREQILIDGGRDDRTLLTALGRVMPFYDRTLDVVIATHPDADHVGGFATLFDRYRVGEYITTGATGKSDDFTLLARSLERQHIAKDIPGRQGVSLELNQGGKLTLLYPPSLPLPEDLETNDGSIIARFDFGETSFLFTGDLPHEETFLPGIEPVDVLKVAHHGSRYSTSDAWIDLVQPKEAVISVGKNSYGHPTPEVMDRLKRRGIATYRTDELGSIVYQCFAAQNRCVHQE